MSAQGPDDDERSRVRVERSPSRCPYCHDELSSVEDVVACAECGARHHRGCQSEHGACATCGSSKVLVPAREDGSPAPVGLATQHERGAAMLCHLSALAGFFVPFGAILGPLLFWLLKRRSSALVDEHGRRSLDFQITWQIVTLLSLVAIIVGGAAFHAGLVVLLGMLFFLALQLGTALLALWAAIRANEGKPFHYPLSIPFLSRGKSDPASTVAKSE